MEFAAAVFAIGFTAFFWIAGPGWIGPMFWGGPRVGELIMVVGGLIGVAVGLVWMARIYRADPEPDQRAWRYRARD
jgi:hypothetical protein